MTVNPQAANTVRPRMFGRGDYMLPPTVQTNIPRQHYHGAPGLWAYARGFLVETCYALPWTPVALFVRVHSDNSTDDTTAVVLTMIARDEDNEVVTVVWRQEYDTTSTPDNNKPSNSQPSSDRTATTWQLTIDGAVPHQGTGGVRPSPPILADIIRRAVTN